MISSERSTLAASSVGEEALAILRPGSSGRIQGVYKGGVNIAFPSGLVSLVPESSGKGPLNVTLAAPAADGMLSLGLAVGEPARAVGARLLIGGRLAVDLEGATRHSAVLGFSRIVSAAQLRRNLEEARKTGLECGNMSGLGGLLAAEPGRMAGSSSVASNLFSAFAAKRIDGLVEAFRHADWDSMSGSVSELIGLGPGLTPASDDFLAGLAVFIAAHSACYRSTERASQAIAVAISGRSSGKTTALSEAYLEQAAAGRGNEAVMALCSALLSGGRRAVTRDTRRLVAIGETSGTDALLGVVVGGFLCLDKAPGRRGSQW
jgi:hypothetical protein